MASKTRFRPSQEEGSDLEKEHFQIRLIPPNPYHKDYTMLMPTKFAVSIESPLLTTNIGLIILFS